MNMRGITRVPRVGEKQLYRDRPEWRWYQKYLPGDLQLTGEYVPSEEWWEHHGYTIHLDRYTCLNPVARIVLIHGGGGFILARLLGPLLNPISMPMKWIAPMELISNDPNISRVFMRDRLAGGSIVSMRFLRSLISAKPKYEPESFTVCPVLLVHPAVDPWTPIELSRVFFDRLNVEKDLVLLEGCGHFPVEEPGRYQLESAVGQFVARVAATRGGRDQRSADSP